MSYVTGNVHNDCDTKTFTDFHHAENLGNLFWSSAKFVYNRTLQGGHQRMTDADEKDWDDDIPRFGDFAVLVKGKLL